MMSKHTIDIPRAHPRRLAIGLVGVAVFVAGSLGLGALVNQAHAAGVTCTVAGAGDIAESGGQQMNVSNQILALNPAAVITLGDLAYENGTTADFNAWYTPSWGRPAIKAITHPAPGNHEYGSPEYTTSGADYFTYFGLNQATQSYYAWDICGWRFYSLNSELTTTTSPTRAAELAWLAADVAAHPGQLKVAYWHKPRYSDGSGHGNDATQQDLFAFVADPTRGFKAILNGHDHVFERYSFMTAAGTTATPDTGVREIIVGTGGAGLSGFDGSYPAQSQARVTNSHGVIQLTLSSNAVAYRWADWDGSVSDAWTDTFTQSTNTTASSPPPSSTTTRPPTSTSTPPPSGGTTSTPAPTSPTTTTTTPCPPASTVTQTVTATVTTTVTGEPGAAAPFMATLTGLVTPPARPTS
jgi:hypothetical protein